MTFIVLLIATALVVFWGVAAYNGLIALKNQTANAWKQIDVQLKRRHDLIPNLVNAVKGATKFERETLEAVVSARNQAISVGQGGDVAKIAAVEGQLTGALHRLLAVVEAFSPGDCLPACASGSCCRRSLRRRRLRPSRRSCRCHRRSGCRARRRPPRRSLHRQCAFRP
jgi:hypothetical protein